MFVFVPFGRLLRSVCFIRRHSHAHTLAIPFILLTTKANKIRVCVGRHYTLPLDEKQIWFALFQSVPSSSLASSHTVNGVFNERNEKKKEKKHFFFGSPWLIAHEKLYQVFIYYCAARRDERVYIVCALLRRNIFTFHFIFNHFESDCPSTFRKRNTKK